MSKYEDEALELIELVVENSHHHAAKSFGGRSAPAKGAMFDAKAADTGMLLDKIEKLTEAQNLIMDSLKIQPGSDGLAPVSHVDVSPCSHCSSFEHVELDCPVMEIQRQFPFRPNPTKYPDLSQGVGRPTRIRVILVFITLLMHSNGAGSTRHIISPTDPCRSTWGTQDRHLLPPVFPERSHRHRLSHLRHLQFTPS